MAGNLFKAQQTFATLCRALDELKLKYDRDDSEMKVIFTVRGEDIPIRISIKVDAQREFVMLLSHMPFDIVEAKRMDAAIAVTAVNNVLVNGNFDYDIATGAIVYRMTNSYAGCELGAEVFKYLVICTFGTVDEFNDKLMLLNKGVISLEQFIEQVNK